MGISEALPKGKVLLRSTYAKPLHKRVVRVVATLFLATAFALTGAPGATAEPMCQGRPGPCYDRPGMQGGVDSSDTANSSSQVIHPVCGGQRPGICPYLQAQ